MRADVLILDGRHLLWRTSDAFKELNAEVNGELIGTGGMYGFLSVALRVHHKYGGKVMVAWEARRRKDNFRATLYPEYKRKEEPTEDFLEIIRDMAVQERRLMVMLRLIGVRQYVAVGAEADDVIGRLSKVFGGKGMEVVIYSGDSDMAQLVTENVTLVSPTFRGDDRAYTPQDVFEKHGVWPKHIADLKALAGDNSDNIPGIRGIGPKTAVQAIGALGGVESIIEAANKAANEPGAPWPIAERFIPAIVDNADQIRLYKRLTTIKTDADMELIEPLRDKKRLMDHFRAYKFRSLCAPNELTGLMRMA